MEIVTDRNAACWYSPEAVGILTIFLAGVCDYCRLTQWVSSDVMEDVVSF